MKRARRDFGQQSYDQFFTANSRVTTVQFLGLLVLGGSLIAAGVSVLLIVLSHSGSSVGVFEGLVLLFVFGICASVVYFGVMHLKRAFAGRR
jgi:hypothetical protein